MNWWRHGKQTTPDCRQVLAHSRQVAKRYGSIKVEPSHVALAILESIDCAGALIVFGICRDNVPLTVNVHRELQSQSQPPVKHKPTFSASIGKLMKAARQEARLMGHACVGSEHLVAVFLRDETSLLSRVLLNCGYEPPHLLNEIIDLLTLGGEKTADSGGPPLHPRRLQKQDFPADVREDPLLALFLYAETGMSDAEHNRNPFVQQALKLRPKNIGELARYTANEYVEAIRAVQKADMEVEEND